ncbi:pyridoxal phosphate-dependent aminotransferase [Nannocystaceae bacterium ST9]
MSHPLHVNAYTRAIQPSATLVISARAGELAASGRTIFKFAAGQPDFPPPAPITEAVTRRLQGAQVGYSPVPGFPELRDAIAAELSRFHGRPFSRKQILVSNGAKHTLINLLMTTLEPGDEVIIPAPFWVSYPEMVRLASGTPVLVSCPRSESFKLTPERLAAALGPKTKFVIVNSPSNPTGMAYTSAELRALGEVIAARAPQTWVLTDDIYRRLCYSQVEVASAFQAMKGIAGIEDQIIPIDGVSKSHSMTGWRIGYLAAPLEIAEGINALQGQMTSGASTPAQWAALAALTDPRVPAEVEAMVEKFAERKLAMCEGLRASGLEFVEPDGAFYVFPEVSDLLGEGRRFADDLGLAKWLLEDHGVATVPGSAFGAPGHLRLSFATALAEIRAGMQVFGAAVASLR